jgi:hypothetical protein
VEKIPLMAKLLIVLLARMEIVKMILKMKQKTAAVAIS